jgi:hypothetical protein
MNPIEEGQAAEKLLANPLLQEALATIESALIEQWTESKDSLVREELWHTLQGSRRFKRVFEIMIDNGSIELAMKGKYNEA